MGVENQPTDLNVDVRITSDNRDDDHLLAAFFASFSIRDDNGDETGVGGMSGWIVWSGFEDVAPAADSLSADAAHIGRVAHEVMEQLREDDPFLEDILLLDRIWIEPPWRRRRLVSPMIDRLMGLLRLDVNGCVIVTEPEPQKPQKKGGGPYADGASRDRAMDGLVRSLRVAGFERWKDERAMWKLADGT
ncbi:hypothetical protein ACPW96_22550 [Micromonospora sp. DT81.3]|uniref:hypothetical protein n=1 Tax=Micromonospora sp. DT81.3 TaxID=3416523 RepID=UPI003CE9B837